MGDQLYEAWHEALGHREYRLTFVMAGYGSDPEEAQAFLDGFLTKHPDLGPVVSQDVAADTISVTMSFRAKDPEYAVQVGWGYFTDGGAASGLQPTELVRIEVEPVDAEEDQTTAEHASLQPA